MIKDFIHFLKSGGFIVLVFLILPGSAFAGDSLTLETHDIRILWQNEPHPRLALRTRDADSTWRTISTLSGKTPRDVRYVESEPNDTNPFGEWHITSHNDTLVMQTRVQGHPYQRRISIDRKSGKVHISVALQISGRHPLEWARDTWTFSERAPMDFTWIPNLRPEPDQLIGNHTFRSPAVILQKNGRYIALIPDLDTLATFGHHHETAFNLNVAGEDLPRYSYGMIRCAVDDHVYYRHDSTMYLELPPGKYHYAYDLLTGTGADRFQALNRVTDYLWDRYAAEYRHFVLPQTVPFYRYATYAYTTLLYSGYAVRFTVNGRPAGGCRANPAHKNYFRRPDPIVWNQVWFNGQRSAYGLRYYAEKLDRPVWEAFADRMKEFSLAAPQTQGLFPAMYAYRDGKWWGSIPRLNGEKHRIHIANAAWTATWLLHRYQGLGHDPEIYDFVMDLADFLVRVQRASGAIPAWYDLPTESGGVPVASDTLAASAETGAAALFLGEIARVTGKISYKRTLLHAADFLIDNMLPDLKFLDFETFFSCSEKPVDMRDPFTGLLPYNTYAMYWTAHTLLSAYEISGKSRYLHAGEETMALLDLYQQGGNPPYLSLYTFGGFGVMNTDGEWNDARQAVFAPLYLAYYRVTGEREYFTRGVAALRAAFTLMAIPENRGVSPYTYDAYPTGIMPENFAHAGRGGTSGRSDTDWGEAGALAASAWVEMHYGGLYVNTVRKEAFGIDGCRVTGVTGQNGKLRIRVLEQLGDSRDVILRTDDGKKKNITLEGNRENIINLDLR